MTLIAESRKVASLLEKLGIRPVNFGACSGPDGWIEDERGGELISYNPTTGEPHRERGSDHSSDISGRGGRSHSRLPQLA